jgi:hypothetical protein
MNMDSDFVVGINKSIDAANGETGKTYPAYLHNTLVTEKLDELASAISEGGEGGGTPQVQADWNETDIESKAYIKNKPTIPTAITELNDIPDVDLTNPTDGQTIKYDAALGKWVNAVGGGGSSITVLTDTLTAGVTSITFTDARILADSIVSCATPAGINPTAMTSTTGSVTFYFQSQAADMVVKAVIF